MKIGYMLLSNISIHAPAKGATCLFCRRCCSIQDFNPRSREGSDDHISIHASRICYFNPRSREGSDGLSRGKNKRWLHFNPRSREGSDGRPSSRSGGCRISIHAPAKGATGGQTMSYKLMQFQSTLPRRERHEKL